MLPSLTGGMAGGGELGNVHGSISLDVSQAQAAARSMRDVGQQIESAMQPAARSVSNLEEQFAQMHPDVSALNLEQFGEIAPSMREVGKATEEAAEQVDKGTKKAAGGIKALHRTMLEGVAAFAIITRAANVAFKALEAGAQLELTAERFDRVSLSIGTTGEALRTDLQDATQGMLSSAQSMALATDLIALGLARTHDEAVRLGRVVTELDADMGELTLALANQTTRRFDQLGISLEGFDERLQRMKLTMDDERAFSMAFLEQAEAQIDRVGGVSQTTAGDIRRLQADWALLVETSQQTLALRLGPVLAVLSGRYGEELGAIAEANREASESYDELIEVIERTDKVIGTGFMANLVGGLDALQIQQSENIRVAAQMADSYEEWESDMVDVFGSVDMAWEVLKAGLDRTGELERLRRLGIDTAEEWYEFATAIDEHTDAMQRNDEIMRQLGQSTADVLMTTEEFITLLTTEHDTKLFERQLEEVQQFGEALQELNRLSRGELGPDPLAQGTPSSLAERQEALQEEIALENERGEVIMEWAEEVKLIEEEATAERLKIIARAEEQRAETIAQYEAQIAEEAEDFARERARAAARLEAQIAEIQADRVRQETEWYAELQKEIGEAREQANDDLIELEEEHAARRLEIENRFNSEITDAAGQLDATAVNRLQRQKEEALRKEEDDYEDSREEIEERLQEFITRETEAYEERLRVAREADERRIQEIRDSLAERQRIEDEDRAIRLERLQASHEAQLAAIDAQETARLAQIGEQAAQETAAYEQGFTDRLGALGLYHQSWLEEQEAFQKEAQEKFDEFWGEMIATIESEAMGAAGRQGPAGRNERLPGRLPNSAFAPSISNQSSNVSLTVAPNAVNVYAAPGQDATEVGGEVVAQIDGYFERLLGGRR